MPLDFTLKIYRKFLKTAMDEGYGMTTFEDYLVNKDAYPKVMILRQDVDMRPVNSLDTARLQHALGVKGTYYFRIVPESYHPAIIDKIAALGHEIGYHYEDVAMQNGDLAKAYEKFCEHLQVLRKHYPVKTICMHGSPLSMWDNKLLWTRYSYRDLGITGEPYLDIDFNRVLYITDTGRSWNNSKASVRDKVNTTFQFDLRSTADIIRNIRLGKLPTHIMQNIHPQRWSDHLGLWSTEFIFQNVKNVIKWMLVKRQG